MRRFLTAFALLASSVLYLSSCGRVDNPEAIQPGDHTGESELYGVPIDFSNVGYHQGERQIPTYPVEIVLTAPEDGSDATALIQDAIDRVPPKSAVLLKEGLYKVDTRININRHDIVLRGEGEGTVIKAMGKRTRTLITLGHATEFTLSGSVKVTDDFIPAGQKWVRVANPGAFKKGDRVALQFSPNALWISDLKMDQIPQNDAGTIQQWTPEGYVQRWERTVVGIEEDKVFFDAPLVMELHSKYSMDISLSQIRWERIEECGVENMMLVSDYDPALTDDEEHSWNAIDVRCAENCWIRNIKSAHFSSSLVRLYTGARQITVKDCICTAPVSQIIGGRRYAFFNVTGELCLFENCIADHDRHGLVTGARTPGPNVYLNCAMTNAHSDMGPHQRWATGVLFDNCQTNLRIEVRDRSASGSGHGWTGVSVVYWNCEAGRTIMCQNPWVNGKNWCIGCIGTRRVSTASPPRPEGEWYSEGQHVEPASLYLHQLEKRLSNL